MVLLVSLKIWGPVLPVDSNLRTLALLNLSSLENQLSATLTILGCNMSLLWQETVIAVAMWEKKNTLKVTKSDSL